MKRLDSSNLTIEPTKCQFLQSEACFFGHIAGNGQIRPDPKKIEVVRNFPVPTAKKVKRFFGLASYYRKFIKNFVKIALFLSQLLAGKNNQKKTDFVWGEKENGAFEELKRCLCSEPVLIAPDITKEFIVTTDASDFALGAVLGQGKIGEDKVCNMAPGVSEERNYAILRMIANYLRSYSQKTCSVPFYTTENSP